MFTHYNCKRSITVLLLAAAATAGSVHAARSQATGHGSMEHQPDAHAVTRAICVLHPTAGNTVSGWVEFVATSAGVQVRASVSGLTPGDHGFHIHEYGDCSAADGTAAGGHFNPGGHAHGGPEADVRHAGDLGNLTADSTGNAVYDRLDVRLSFEGDDGIIGRGVVVHAGADDLTSQPTGAAGGRIACGVIGVAAE